MVLEFCTPPVPGQSHPYYGNAHNNFIKLPSVTNGLFTSSNSRNSHNKSNTIQKTVSTNHNSTVHSIASSGNLALLKTILPFLPSPKKAVNEPHPMTGLTPLHFAASRGHFDVVKYLISDYGAAIDARDKEGETALSKAAYNGHFHIVNYLITNNANLHLKDKDGWTALHNACARGYLPITRLLIEKGARVDVRSKMGHTPLINAASKGYISIVEYLLTEAHSNPLLKNNFGEAAYDVSAAAGESYICDMLYKFGQTWWKMTHDNNSNGDDYDLLDYHITVMIKVHENERSSSSILLAGLSKPIFSPNYLTKHDTRGAWSLASTAQPCSKNEIPLPPNGDDSNNTDWFWLTDWQIDYSDPRIDPTSGWQYARSFDDPDDVWTPVTPTSGYGWVRRRTWVRVMKRKMDLLRGNSDSSVSQQGQQSSYYSGSSELEDDDYLYAAEDIVQRVQQQHQQQTADAVTNSKDIKQLTKELRALEEAVQLLRAGIKNDGNPYRVQQAESFLKSYTAQINTLNSKISQSAETLSTPITSISRQHINSELARELGFVDNRNDSGLEIDTPNPWSHNQLMNSLAPSAIISTTEASIADQQNDNDEAINTEQSKLNKIKRYVWENDLDVRDCRGCGRRFGLLVRRHHCRCCGLIHCDRCSMSRAYLGPTQILQNPNGPLESLDILASQHQRVCDTCYAKLGGIPP